MSSCSHPQSTAFLTHHIALDRVQDTCASDRHKETATLRVPMKLRRFGARKVIVRADQIDVDEGNAKARETKHHPLLTALIRAWRWKTMIERS